MRTLISILAAALFFLCTTIAYARLLGIEGPDPAVISSDDAAKREVERIQKMPLSKSPALNQEALAEARSYVEAYSSFQDRITSLEKISPDATKKRVADALELIPKYLKGCQRKPLAEQLLVTRRQLSQFDGLGFDGYIRFPGQSESLSESDEATIQEVAQFLELPIDKVCSQYADKSAIEATLNQISAAVTIASNRLQKNISTLKEQAPRAKSIAQAWEKRRDELSKSIENQSAPVNIVADQLGWIIGVFCGFGILMFISVNVFKEAVQIELVASGQVIQFATVMVLLIVVCVLGMSKLLSENVLGTLLGGIGGYVLSQGVGRAATRAATRDSTPPP